MSYDPFSQPQRIDRRALFRTPTTLQPPPRIHILSKNSSMAVTVSVRSSSCCTLPLLYVHVPRESRLQLLQGECRTLWGGRDQAMRCGHQLLCIAKALPGKYQITPHVNGI